MPYFKAKSKKKKDVQKAVKKNIHSLAHGPHAGERTQKQNIAAAYSIAEGKSEKKKSKPVGDKPAGRKRKRPRNKGRS